MGSLLSKSLLALAFLLAGCGHVPVMSLIKLARLDLASTNPAQLRAAVKLPHALQPRTQGMVLRVSVKTTSGQELKQEFALQEISDPIDLLPLHAELSPGTHIFAYRIDPKDLPRLTEFRANALAQPRIPGGGTLSIYPQACRNGEIPAGPILVSTFLRAAEIGEYIALTRNVDLRTLAPGHDLAAIIPPCR
jgi:hypothetical protein